MADKDTATIWAGRYSVRTHAWELCCTDSSQPRCIRGYNSRMPAVDPADSCSPMSHTMYGSSSPISSSANPSELSPSASRRNSSPANSTSSITPARFTDGVNPTSSINAITASMVMTAAGRRRHRSNRSSACTAPAIMLKCKPDTTSKCDTPHARKSSLIAPDNTERSPRHRLFTNAAGSPDK